MKVAIPFAAALTLSACAQNSNSTPNLDDALLTDKDERILQVHETDLKLKIERIAETNQIYVSITGHGTENKNLPLVTCDTNSNPQEIIGFLLQKTYSEVLYLSLDQKAAIDLFFEDNIHDLCKSARIQGYSLEINGKQTDFFFETVSHNNSVIVSSADPTKSIEISYGEDEQLNIWLEKEFSGITPSQKIRIGIFASNALQTSGVTYVPAATNG